MRYRCVRSALDCINGRRHERRRTINILDEQLCLQIAFVVIPGYNKGNPTQ